MKTRAYRDRADWSTVSADKNMQGETFFSLFLFPLCSWQHPVKQWCKEHRLINTSMPMQLRMFWSKYIYYVNNDKKKDDLLNNS